jgi:hypothetical protein
MFIYLFIIAENGAVARATGGEEKECITEYTSQWQLNEKARWALNCGSGEGGGDEKGRRRGEEKRAMHVWRVRPMATGLPSVFMLMRKATAFAKMRPNFPLNARVECRAKNPGWFALARHKGGSILRFPDEPAGKEDVEAPRGASHPGHEA